MARIEIVHNIRQKPADTAQGNGLSLSEQYRWFCRLLGCYLEVNPIAKILCLETGTYMSVQDDSLPLGKWEVVFKPDIGIIRGDNPAP